MKETEVFDFLKNLGSLIKGSMLAMKADNMPILVQNLLRNGASLEQIKEQYKLEIKRGIDFPNLVLFKYNQFESDFKDPLVQQCRGLILDESDGWRVISYPFNKFFNYNEPLAHTIDWDCARCQEKLDGSLCQVYWYKNEWRVGTSGTPDGSGEVNGYGITFKELFWEVWNKLGYELPECKSATYIFELMTQKNRVVVDHTTDRIVWIGMRGNAYSFTFFSEISVSFVKHLYNWETVKEYPLRTIEDILTTFKEMDPLQQEGYVVVDMDFNRVKVKHPGYIALHRTINKMSPRHILDLIRMGEYDEVVGAFAKYKNEFDSLYHIFHDLVKQIEETYNNIKDLKTQKEFALEACKYPFKDVLFSLRSGKKTSVKQYMTDVRLDNILNWMEVK